jgi:hypothetical protein
MVLRVALFLASRSVEVGRLSYRWTHMSFSDTNPGNVDYKKYLKERGVSNGWAWFLVSWALGCFLLKLETLPRNPSLSELQWGAQAPGQAGLSLSWAAFPFFSPSLVDIWDHPRNITDVWCWLVLYLNLGEWHESLILHNASSMTENEIKCSYWVYT